MHRLSSFLIAASVLCLTAACSRGDSASAEPRNKSQVEPPRFSVIAPAAGNYKVVPVSDPGSITGTVDFEGVMPAIASPPEDPACGRLTATAGGTITRAGTKMGGVLVWLTDIRSGKDLPTVRRYDLMNDHCTLDPHLQVMLTSGTLNVGSEDRVQHLDRFIDVATGETVALAPFNDEGEVVPLDHTFTKPAEIEVVCDLHPSSLAWLAVLDHPYYATTGSAGAFSIDGIPPGRYHVRAWHPAVGIADDSVTVIAGKPVTLALRLLPKSSEGAARPRALHPVPGGFIAPKPSLSDSSADSIRADTGGTSSTR